MLKINIVAVGKVKENYFQQGIDEYLKRLSRFAEVKITEIKEENFTPENSALTIKKEGESIEQLLKGYIVCMAIEGKQVSSVELSEKISSLKTKGVSDITFVIGGSYGIAENIKAKSNFLFSFSKMTFPHTLFRLMLAEQLYRSFMIDSGGTYHK